MYAATLSVALVAILMTWADSAAAWTDFVSEAIHNLIHYSAFSAAKAM